MNCEWLKSDIIYVRSLTQHKSSEDASWSVVIKLWLILSSDTLLQKQEKKGIEKISPKGTYYVTRFYPVIKTMVSNKVSCFQTT